MVACLKMLEVISMIAIIDYDAGNIKSVQKAIESLGEEVILTREPEVLLAADHVILPGVGSFGDAMEKLHNYNLIPVIHQIVEKKVPFLGICLGLQLLFDSSEESPGVEGLGLLKGKIVRFDDKEGYKIPHMGWNSLTELKTRLFEGLKDGDFVYFVHSFAADVCDDSIAVSNNGRRFSAAMCMGNFYGAQFHPEKSGDVGERILRNFVNL